ncbi:MarR family winged helix-turn-helix transcriptional regulator [Candidatus Stoquefichus massiliensis]|uniref:MarR family winged helix-turn-helix transcriptional regulator n=1 Tax=Candidatus Stoquefichus massiliensis TaxID=1470350 RepID=UPI0004AE6B06|nr:helix-turn-helix domain-containing protein [Candidatus Stoquefichus massiliensis]
MDYQECAKKVIECVLLNQRTGNIVYRHVSDIAKGEIGVLLYLNDENNGANAYEISQKFDVNTSRVAAVLNSLSKKGFIQRVADPLDKRKIQVYITDKGRRYGEEHRQEIILKMSKVLSQLGEYDAKEYVRILQKISNIVENCDEEVFNHND